MPELAAEGDCPPDLQAQDSHVISVLGDGFRASVDGPGAEPRVVRRAGPGLPGRALIQSF